MGPKSYKPPNHWKFFFKNYDESYSINFYDLKTINIIHDYKKTRKRLSRMLQSCFIENTDCFFKIKSITKKFNLF